MTATVIPLFPDKEPAEVTQFGPVLELQLERERRTAAKVALEFILAGKPGQAQYALTRSVLRQAKWLGVNATISACQHHGLTPCEDPA